MRGVFIFLIQRFVQLVRFYEIETWTLYAIVIHLSKKQIFPAREESASFNIFIHDDVFRSITFSCEADDLVDLAFVVFIFTQLHV